jgi:hypothetical protein
MNISFIVFVDTFRRNRRGYYTTTKRLEIEAENIVAASELALAKCKGGISSAVSMIWPKV